VALRFNHEEAFELTGAYVLGALSAEERSAFEVHLASCSRCTAEVRALRPVTDALGQGSRPIDPPPGARASLAHAIAAADATRDSAPPRAAWPAWLAIAATLALVVGAGSYAINARRESDRHRLVNSVLAAPDLARIDLAGQPAAPSATARAYWSRSNGLVLLASNLPPLPAGRTYQLWVLTAEPAPISAGLLQPDRDGHASMTVVTPVNMPAPVAMAVTIEPAGGVPLPTGDKYLVGPAN
jgi:anti-sigma-K factor RskA